MELSFRLLTATLLLCGTISAGESYNSGADPWVYDPNGVMGGTGLPTDKPMFAHPGDRAPIRVRAVDTDKKRPKSKANDWTEYKAGNENHSITLKVDGKAKIDHPNGTSKEVTIPGLDTGPIYVEFDADWNDGSSVIVTYIVTDTEPDKTAPDEGTARDPQVQAQLTFKRNTIGCPSDVSTIDGPTNEWKPDEIRLTYQVGPNPPPSYLGVIIKEEFETPTPIDFGMGDLTDAFKTDYPTVTTPEAAAALLFSSGNNSVFPIDAANCYKDRHAGSLTEEAITQFNPEFVRNGKGFGYSIGQKYKCGQAVLSDRTYIIKRKFGIKDNSAFRLVWKSGP